MNTIAIIQHHQQLAQAHPTYLVLCSLVHVSSLTRHHTPSINTSLLYSFIAVFSQTNVHWQQQCTGAWWRCACCPCTSARCWTTSAGVWIMSIINVSFTLPPSISFSLPSLHLSPSFSLAKKYNVDIALWGHHHSYQRTCPVQQQKCTEGSPVHLVIGMGGQGLSKDIRSVSVWLIKCSQVNVWWFLLLALSNQSGLKLWMLM